MSSKGAVRLPARTWRLVGMAGIAVGIVYALSPLTVWFVVGLVPIIRWAGRGLDPDERRWAMRVLIVALAARLAAVAVLFVLTNHSQVPFGSFFGDEEYFIKRSLWLRSVALDFPVRGDDLVTAFESYSASSYLYLLALVQILVGPAPYGLHLLGILSYLLAVVLLYRLVRPTLGRVPALLGLTVLLFLPSLFAWSISTLKEPLFALVSAVNLVLAVEMARGPTWGRRALAVTAIVALAAVLESMRQGGAVLSALGVVIGLIIGVVITRPRLVLATLVVTPILIGATLSRPDVQLKAYTAIQGAARQHWGHVASPGYSYELLDQRFYPATYEVSDLQFAEMTRFLVRAGVAYVTVPLPWNVQSRSALLYLPEQIVWYVLVALAPVGLAFAFRRDAVVTGLLFGHAIVAAVTVALTSGNVGTLVRHRGLALPYVVWLSAVGGCELLRKST